MLDSWQGVHAAVQVLAVLCGAAGIALAVLGCGFKWVPSVRLYEPHKWIGLVVLLSALLQLLAVPFKPPRGARGRACWSGAHHAWGRLTVVVGVGNAFLGVLLMHDLRGQALARWLIPAAACAGAVVFAALLLEAVKMQMQRTHRYDPKTNKITEVFDACHHSKRRMGDEYNGAAAGSGTNAWAGTGTNAWAGPVGGAWNGGGAYAAAYDGGEYGAAAQKHAGGAHAFEAGGAWRGMR